jgi:hypothetical protein
LGRLEKSKNIKDEEQENGGDWRVGGSYKRMIRNNSPRGEGGGGNGGKRGRGNGGGGYLVCGPRLGNNNRAHPALSIPPPGHRRMGVEESWGGLTLLFPSHFP